LHALLIGLETAFQEKLKWLEKAEILGLRMRGEVVSQAKN